MASALPRLLEGAVGESGEVVEEEEEQEVVVEEEVEEEEGVDRGAMGTTSPRVQ